MAKKKEKGVDIGKATLGYIGGGIAGKVGATAIGAAHLKYIDPKPTTKETLKMPKEKGSKILTGFSHPILDNKISPRQLSPEAKKVYSGMKKDYGLGRIELRRSSVSAYNPMTKTVLLRNPKHPEVLAHELGHAVDMRKGMKVKSILRVLGPGAGLLTAGGMLATGDKDVQKYAPGALVAGATPMLYQEAKASTLGVKQMAKTLGKARAAKGALKLLPAFATYLLGTTGAAAGLHMAINSKNKK
jgi:hypothetical protein